MISSAAVEAEIRLREPAQHPDGRYLRSTGDLLLKLDRAGIYQISDIWTFTRARSAGEEIEATYVRDRQLRRGRAELSRFEDFGD
jgi:hypothetical protein